MKRFNLIAEFQAYLADSQTQFLKSPFGCKYLRVLSEDIVVQEGLSIFNYNLGTPICSEMPGRLGGDPLESHKCGFDTVKDVMGWTIRRGAVPKEGVIEIACKRGHLGVRVNLAGVVSELPANRT